MINLIWWNEPSSLFEYESIISLLSGFNVNHIVDLQQKVGYDNAIIVANLTNVLCRGQGGFRFLKNYGRYTNERHRLHNYIKALKNAGTKVGLFHVGDEFYIESTDFYQDCDFVFRQNHKEEAHKIHKSCHYLPLCCKAGFSSQVIDKPIHERPYMWSFAGQLKSSRYKMIKYAKKIPGGKYRTTSQFNDPNGLNAEGYAALLSNTKFSLCPGGNYTVDCSRVLESLEAGAIPIIEAKNFRHALQRLFNPKLLINHGIRDRRFWLRNYRYWERAYSTDFPCPLIYDWKDLEALISSIDVKSSSQKIRLWWKEYKHSFDELIRLTIEDAFSQKA